MSNQLQLVETISNKIVHKSACRKYKDGYYQKGVDCFFIEEENKWYKLNSGLIELDELNNKVYKKSSKLPFIYVVSSFNLDIPVILKTVLTYDNTILYNEYDTNKATAKFVYVDNLQTFKCYIKKDLTLSIIQGLVSGSFDFNKYSNEIFFKNQSNYFNFKGLGTKYNPSQFSYTSDNSLESYLESNNYFIENYLKNNISKSSEDLSKYLDKYKVGIELETSEGVMPDFISSYLGFIPLRDGSLRNRNTGEQGLEYATIPLQTPGQIESFKLGTKLLQALCKIDINCSVHVHISGLNLTKENLVATYCLLYKLQDEFYSYFPDYKKINDGTKRQNYTASLVNLTVTKEDGSIDVDKTADSIINYLSSGRYTKFSKDLNLFNDETSKWNIPTRYHIWNFISWVFSKRSTLENRLHTPTLNYDKIYSWIIINVGILKFIEKESVNIIKQPNQKFSILESIIANIQMIDISNHYLQYRKELKINSDKHFKIEMYEDNLYKNAYINLNKQKSAFFIQTNTQRFENIRPRGISVEEARIELSNLMRELEPINTRRNE